MQPARQMTRAQIERSIRAITAVDPDAAYEITPFAVRVLPNIDSIDPIEDVAEAPESWND